MQRAHFLKAFYGETLTGKRGKTDEAREIKGRTFLLLDFVIFLFYGTVETYDKKWHFSVQESGNFLFLDQISGF